MNEKREEILNNAYKAIQESGFNSTTILPTGTGKSSLMVKALVELNPESVWYLCDSVENRNNTFRNELIKWGAEEFIERITFMCYQSACKIQGAKVDLVLADEADYAATPVYIKGLKNNKFKHKVLVSATLNNNKRKIIEAIAPVTYEESLETIEGEGIVNESKYYFVNYDLNKSENLRYLKFNATFVSLLAQKRPNNFAIQQTQIARKLFLSTLFSSAFTCKRLLEKLYKEPYRKILIFCGTAKQADVICKYSYHTMNNAKENYENFDRGNIRVLSVVGKLDRGVNINAVNTSIFEAPGSSNTKFQQQQGRSKRLDKEDTADVFFLIPHYIDKYGNKKSTVVKGWVEKNLEGLKAKPEIYEI